MPLVGIGAVPQTSDKLRQGARGVVANLGAKSRTLVPTKCLLQIALVFRLLEPK